MICFPGASVYDVSDPRELRKVKDIDEAGDVEEVGM